MNETLDLFKNYPDRAGFQDGDTSKAAADDIESAGRAETLRGKALELLGEYELTADECAGMMGEDILSIRPRITELLKQGKIEDTGKRRENHHSGKKAKVMRAKK